MAWDFSVITENWQFLLRAYGMTILLSATSISVGLALGIVIGTGRVYGPRYIDIILGFFVDTMRAIPVLVLLVWGYLALPILLNVKMDPLAGATVMLGLHLSAYVAETVRSGLASIRKNQFRAALSLGMTPLQSVQFVVLPQALIRMIPPLGSFIIIAVKDSAIASVIAFPELLRASQTLVGQTFHPIEIYTTAMLMYLLTLYPIARLFELVYTRLAPRGAS